MDIIKDLVQSQEIIDKLFGSVRSNICKQCIWLYQLNAFRVGFLNKILLYTMSILIINVIDCKRKGCTEAFTYALSILNKSSIARKISIFENLNVIQIEIKKRWSVLGWLADNLVERFENTNVNAWDADNWYWHK